MSVLVTGGAGYVGSHVARALAEAQIPHVLLDNLTRGHRELAVGAELVVGEIGDVPLMRDTIRRFDVDAVLHLAAYAYVGESVQQPGKYYQNNVAATLALLEAMVASGVRQIVFSSSCATYGVPDAVPIAEDHPQRPVNPYGASKLMAERILQDFDRAHGVRSVVLRYFNAAGAHPSGELGESHDPETHLIPLTLHAASGKAESVAIFGTDYPTPDGTCVRDYVHVCDLADAHILGLRHLQAGGASDCFNLGNGSGFSVRQVIQAAERVTGKRIGVREAPRRPGDPAILVGSSERARRVLGWRPQLESIDTIVRTAWNWHQRQGH